MLCLSFLICFCTDLPSSAFSFGVPPRVAMMAELAGSFVFLKAVSILLSLGLCLATDGRADGLVVALLVGL